MTISSTIIFVSPLCFCSSPVWDSWIPLHLSQSLLWGIAAGHPRYLVCRRCVGVWERFVKQVRCWMPLPQLCSPVFSTKVDELWESGKFLIQCNSPCVLALTKTLLRNKTDSDLEVDGFGKLFLLVRDSSETSKSLSGGLCLYGNKNWCNTDYQGDFMHS